MLYTSSSFMNLYSCLRSMVMLVNFLLLVTIIINMLCILFESFHQKGLIFFICRFFCFGCVIRKLIHVRHWLAILRCNRYKAILRVLHLHAFCWSFPSSNLFVVEELVCVFIWYHNFYYDYGDLSAHLMCWFMGDL